MQKRKIQNELNTPCIVKNLPLNHGAIAAPYKTNFLPSSGVCHLTIYGGHCHVGPPPLQLLVKEGKSKFLALVRSASGQLALVESDGARGRMAMQRAAAAVLLPLLAAAARTSALPFIVLHGRPLLNFGLSSATTLI